MKRYRVCIALMVLGAELSLTQKAMNASASSEESISTDEELFHQFLGEAVKVRAKPKPKVVKPVVAPKKMVKVDDETSSSEDDTPLKLIASNFLHKNVRTQGPESQLIGDIGVKDLTRLGLEKVPEKFYIQSMLFKALEAGTSLVTTGTNCIDSGADIADEVLFMTKAVLGTDGGFKDAFDELQEGYSEVVKAPVLGVSEAVAELKAEKEKRSFESLLLPAYKGEWAFVKEQIVSNRELLKKRDKEERSLLHYAALGYINENNLEAWKMFIILLKAGAVSTEALRRSLAENLSEEKKIRQAEVVYEVARADDAASRPLAAFPCFHEDPTAVPIERPSKRSFFSSLWPF